MTAMREVETEELVARLHHGHEYGHVGLRARVGLYVGILSSEKFLDAVDGKLFGFVDYLTSAIVTVAGIAFGIFVCQA